MKRLGMIGTGACLCLLSATARAEDKGESIYVDMQGSLVNQYYFRGMRQGAKGVVMQGGADMRVALYDEDDFKFQTVGGGFLSFHPSDARGGDTLSASLLELRGHLGLGVSSPVMEVRGFFQVYTSPNRSFDDVYEVVLNGTFKDDALWAGNYDDELFRGFFPTLTLAQEVGGARDGGDHGTYLEVAVAPTLRVLHSALLNADFSFPASLGMSLHNYYQLPSPTTLSLKNHFLGYASVGFLADFEQRWLPDRLGGWHGRVGIDVLFPKAQRDAATPHVDKVEPVFRGELVLEF